MDTERDVVPRCGHIHKKKKNKKKKGCEKRKMKFLGGSIVIF